MAVTETETETETLPITREFYEAFQRGELDRWDAIIAEDVLINSTIGFGMKGLEGFKEFAPNFVKLGKRIDLVDEHLALDDQGTGRGFVTFCLHWSHTDEFLGMEPTGREGTSIETAIFTIVENKIVRIDVALNTIDLGLYEWERGWPSPHNVHPEPIDVRVDGSETLSITREFYDAFARGELDRWDDIMAKDLLFNSPAGYGTRGYEVFKEFAPNFVRLADRIDLVDEHLALDNQGTGRGFVTFCLDWSHNDDFGGIPPTGRKGTSIESAIFTIVENEIVRMDVADHSVDLALYLWERGWPSSHNVNPEAIVVGVDRRNGA
jgi:ketosteroid isomerase-like protein